MQKTNSYQHPDYLPPNDLHQKPVQQNAKREQDREVKTTHIHFTAESNTHKTGSASHADGL